MEIGVHPGSHAVAVFICPSRPEGAAKKDEKSVVQAVEQFFPSLCSEDEAFSREFVKPASQFCRVHLLLRCQFPDALRGERHARQQGLLLPGILGFDGGEKRFRIRQSYPGLLYPGDEIFIHVLIFHGIHFFTHRHRRGRQPCSGNIHTGIQ